MPKCHNSRTDPSTRIITLAPLQGARNCAASSADSQTFAHRVSRSGLHVMGHDNQEHAPFKDHQDRKRALETLEGSCQKPDWRIDAYVLMDHRRNTPWQSGFRKCQNVIILGLTLPIILGLTLPRPRDGLRLGQNSAGKASCESSFA